MSDVVADIFAIWGVIPENAVSFSVLFLDCFCWFVM